MINCDPWFRDFSETSPIQKEMDLLVEDVEYALVQIMPIPYVRHFSHILARSFENDDKDAVKVWSKLGLKEKHCYAVLDDAEKLSDLLTDEYFGRSDE